LLIDMRFTPRISEQAIGHREQYLGANYCPAVPIVGERGWYWVGYTSAMALTSHAASTRKHGGL
jgi:hypothetical protein